MVGGLYIAVAVASEDGYFVAGVAPDLLRQFHAGSIDLRSLLLGSDENERYITNAENCIEDALTLNPLVKPLSESEHLPEDGFFLHASPAGRREQLLLPTTELRGQKNTTKSKRPEPFTWHPGAAPPQIQSHTTAKLLLLTEYLDRYFDVVCAKPQMDVLRIAFVDMFSGGGLYKRGPDLQYGSPLVMIDAVNRARRRVNTNRRKELRIDAKYFFVDENEDAIECLRESLRTTAIADERFDTINIQRATASESLPGIIKNIKNWSATGRSIFFLDQCGYSKVPHRDVRLIYDSLPKSEIIATYNFGALYDYMNESLEFLSAVAPIELSPDHLKSLLKERDKQAGRFFVGRLLGDLFQGKSRARFMSRFFLRSEEAHRDMWFVHYSKVMRSRLVMNDAHWSVGNASVTQGEAGLDMVGFRPDWEGQIEIDFDFSDPDVGGMHESLLKEFPQWLQYFDSDIAPTVGEMLARSADSTAATEDQLKHALMFLERQGEINVLTPTGAKKKGSAILQPHHRLTLPTQYRWYF